jgi:hypothetical protein
VYRQKEAKAKAKRQDAKNKKTAHKLYKKYYRDDLEKEQRTGRNVKGQQCF